MAEACRVLHIGASEHIRLQHCDLFICFLATSFSFGDHTHFSRLQLLIGGELHSQLFQSLPSGLSTDFPTDSEYSDSTLRVSDEEFGSVTRCMTPNPHLHT